MYCILKNQPTSTHKFYPHTSVLGPFSPQKSIVLGSLSYFYPKNLNKGESFKTLKLPTFHNFRGLKISKFQSFRDLKLSKRTTESTSKGMGTGLEYVIQAFVFNPVYFRYCIGQS